MKYRKEENLEHSINIGNPVVNVNVGGCKEEKREKKKKECECKGMVNRIISPTNRLIVDICPHCTIKGSKIIDQSNNSLFTATTFSSPSCFITAQGLNLATGGAGEYIFFGTTYIGAYGLLLQERPGAFDRLLLTFVGVSAAGGILASFTVLNLPDAELTITPCIHDHECSCKNSTVAFPLGNMQNFANDLNGGQDVGRVIVTSPEGEVEIYQK
ncbi:hypothetical protein [Sutcliffiella deserti]|uniref:hypothetical protein n=1 Tax=Sutcliffiella deserti TaxID=2875501 RepID=UPI001CBE3AB9|nr:hypothetical protein [Sutcliffiella deserti]